MAGIPDKPSLGGLEEKWDRSWQEDGTYRFDRSKDRGQIFAIDTPPPTISGSLHLGTAFGYIQADAIARFQRMRGREVFYPMGWDDNGLPTERRVQSHYGVRCDPSLPYDPDLEVQAVSGSSKDQRPVSRPNFVELCQQLTVEFEGDFERQWRRMGLSVDWELTYATIDERSRRTAQRAFLRNLSRGDAYTDAAPTMWDVDFQTAVAQAEMEDRPEESAYHRLAFPRADGAGEVEIETTRPELLPSCVALVVHPDDERFVDVVGTHVCTPVFAVEVPVLAHPLAEPDKGVGVAMICTFGDTTDVAWWRELHLPTRSVLRRDGRFQSETPEWLCGEGTAAWEKLAGRTVVQARRSVVDLLIEAGATRAEPRKITHDVKFYEKGSRPLEIVTSRQWYLRNGARDQDVRDVLFARGRELTWHPDFMRLRYEHWVGGLNTDWLISRQRYFGVPFPVWYPVSADGEAQWKTPLIPDESSLPIDPQNDVPTGYRADQRGEAHGFVGDEDVMDTWATSSLTPEIAGKWEDDPDLFDRLFPMDLRPQGPEIIRTWLFSTILRSQLEHGVLPWRNTMINGWILDPDRKKMSKSKDNVLTPMPLVDEFGADALRYWSCKSATGTDTAVDKSQMKIGRRLSVKLLNAARFVVGMVERGGAEGKISADLDRALVAQLDTVVRDATSAMERYDYHRALERTEDYFWSFCDDYLELVKQRASDDGRDGESARATLLLSLDVVLRLLAPFLPFATEEVWSWRRSGSVHRTCWPDPSEWAEAMPSADPVVLETVSAVLVEVRKAKTAGRRSQRSAVERLVVEDGAEQLNRVRAGEGDLRRAGSVAELLLREGPVRSVEVTLSEEASASSR